ncbi:MAG: hypothetical protein J5685_07990 [Clostridiales bacterium]|nr:hypothetical protein [Clostridiales bacterium]
MGFLDSFKDAMKRGSEAANNYIERERAKEASAAAASPATARTAPSGGTGPSGRSSSTHSTANRLPEGVFAIALTHDEIFECGLKSDGTPLRVSAFGEIRMKAKDPSQFEGKDQRAIAKEIIYDALRNALTGREDDLNELKRLMLLPRQISPVITDALNSAGFEAAFKMPLMLKPQ